MIVGFYTPVWLVTSPAQLRTLISSLQGGKNIYCVDCRPGHPLAATEETLVGFDIHVSNIISVIC